jgi:GxxExxY protein
MDINFISGQIVDAAMAVHSELGPGLLEHTYKICLKLELLSRAIQVESEVGLPVKYKNNSIDLGYRLDLLVENRVVVELKAVQQINPIHKAQLLTYLRLANKPLGLILNFHTLHMRDGITRMVHSHSASSESSAVNFD